MAIWECYLHILIYLYAIAKKTPANKEEFNRQKKEELEKRLEDVSGKLGMPKKPRKGD